MQPKEVFKEIYNLPFAQLCLLRSNNYIAQMIPGGSNP